jgi:NMD protein affecting ribosome stability and mRNA decay
MCMTTCHDCGQFIDTDADPGCYIEIGNMKRLHKEVPVCESCRDEREAQEWAAEAAADAAQEAEEAASTWFQRAGALS